MGQTAMGPNEMRVHPSVPYRPTRGLVALFSRTGTGTSSRNPSASRKAASRRSYAEVVRGAMDNGGSNRGARDAAANRGTGGANGQADMVGRGGFQQFHPGYGGDHGV